MNATQSNAVPDPRDTEQLLSDLAWVQRLAFRLCSNAALAEDLRQEAALAALGRTVPAEGATRRWLAGVVQKQLLMLRRAGARRTAREASVALPEAPGAEVDVVERAEVQALVSEAVLDLSEPYRTVILRRYFDEWTPTEIAERTGTPIDTVKSRLKRGLEQLEGRLGKRFGVADGDVRNRTGWYGALLPLAVMESQRRAQLAGVAGSAAASSLPWLSTLTLAMSLKLLALPAILLALFFLLRESRQGAATPFDDVPVARGVDALDAQRSSVSSEAPVELAGADVRTVRGGATQDDPLLTARETENASTIAVVTGRVLDSLGRPLGGARVSARTGAAMPLSARGPSVATVTTEPDGRFQLPTATTEPGAFWLHIEAGPYEQPVHIELGTKSSRARLPLVRGTNDLGAIVMAAGGVIRGRVIDVDGRPASDATVQIIGEQVLQTEPDGSFELVGLYPTHAEVRAYSGTSLIEERGVFVAPRTTIEGLELRLRPAPALEGQVLDERGKPVEGARVRMESVDDLIERTAASDSNGTFRIPFTVLGGAELEVEADGYERWRSSDLDLQLDPSSSAVRVELKRSAPQTTESTLAGASPATGTADPAPIVGGVLHGRVLRNGEPAGDTFVRVESGTRMGERMARLRGSGDPDEFLATGLFDQLIRVADDGTFRIDGLGASLYRLSFSSWKTATFALPVVKLRRGESVDLGAIELPDGGTIRGHVMLPPGVSPLGLEVTCGRGFGAVSGLLDDGARFELKGVPLGRQEVTLSARAGLVDEGGAVAVDVASGSTADVVLDATALGLVALRLRFDLGSVQPDGYRALLRPVDDPKEVLLSEFLDADGRIGGFVRSAGEVTVHLVDRSLNHVQGPQWRLRLEPGQSLDETLAFQFGTLVLELGAGRRVPSDGELHVRLEAVTGAALSEFLIEFEEGEPIELAEKAARWARLANGNLQLQLDRVPSGTFDVSVTMLDQGQVYLNGPPQAGGDALQGEVWLDRVRVTVTPR